MLIINKRMLKKFELKDLLRLQQELHETDNLTEENYDVIEDYMYEKKYLNNLRSSKLYEF